MVLLGLISLVAALLCLAAQRHLGTRALLFSGAALSLVSVVALLTIGVTDGVLAVLAVSAGVCVASVGSVVLIRRSVRRPGGVR